MLFVDRREKAAEVVEAWRRYKKSLPRFASDALTDATEIKFSEIASGTMAGGTGFALASSVDLPLGCCCGEESASGQKYKKGNE
jgi:hypothetical protein